MSWTLAAIPIQFCARAWKLTSLHRVHTVKAILLKNTPVQQVKLKNQKASNLGGNETDIIGNNSFCFTNLGTNSHKSELKWLSTFTNIKFGWNFQKKKEYAYNMVRKKFNNTQHNDPNY